MSLYLSEQEYMEEQGAINYDEQQHEQNAKFAEFKEKKLWRGTLNEGLATAYQAVIDSIADKDVTGEIREVFNKYCSLLDENIDYTHSPEKLKPLLLHFFVSGMENVKCDNCGDNPNGKSFEQVLSENEEHINDFFKSSHTQAGRQ